MAKIRYETKQKLYSFFLMCLFCFICIISVYSAIPKTDAKGAIHILQNEGYKNIEITGHGYFKCSNSDAFSTNFTATNLAGNKVNGTVCSGYFKGSTIRFN